ncbi:valine--tRNA ligase [Candidatus Amesbacteria bacterium RIFCSPLOWO2_01_FULL_49_25]|uniref:Valine--tRNA ligase n=1 Tax=Candidatus Amesbacteria bacterium RIFCSPHIGHO2_01_FULL_48_32b TaxID=1797253 RepID=A0A1F4YIN6_9BACT|nr:MAG: valine--tRNA ligase [Candidatus Amesbacteria bacterium RIFCSPHIGHO2_01_FULL_48_32b]OGD07401.1 MAG: valine--tRNA ligase [Candidatus Amesbacteria bacterium RIFCSPLOWO2_01_FULL_49_25]
MDKNFDHKKYEKEIYEMWEKSGAFTPKIDKGKKPFTIILPPPNASGGMHTGNVLMIAIEDILVRWHRMKGDPTLWVPGTDHAGTETQITYERELKKEGKSRFQFDRETLYKNIAEFVFKNKRFIENQIRAMGASVDWTRYKFTLDEDVLETVRSTFEKLHKDGLVYRDNYMVNYCPVCGTTYADIEVAHEEKNDPLYFMKYGPFTIATVRPESKFRDTALAVNPKDKRYKEWLGKKLEIPGLLGPITMTVIPDPEVNPEFGTGIMKVTPAHDPHDFELGKKFNLPVLPIIDLEGRMDFSWFLSQNDADSKYRARAEKYHKKKVREARKLMVEDLKEDGLLLKTDEGYVHTVPTCKAGHEIEPTVLPNWFIKVDSLKEAAFKAVKTGKIKIYPKWREITYTRWMEAMHDWAISRQNVWGIRLPVWYSLQKNPTLQITYLKPDGQRVLRSGEGVLATNELNEAKAGLQQLRAPIGSQYEINQTSPGSDYLQETDTFDTWFSSGQWPLVTLGYPDSEDFKYFYPTSVMETAWEILSKWVSRMIMFGIYLTGEVPFRDVYLHGIVRALDGRKMSKSLGNVINPEEYIEQYGVDALRMGLISGTANGRDFNFPRDRVIAYRNFANKLWNLGRFTMMKLEELDSPTPEFDKKMKGLKKQDREILAKLKKLIKTVDEKLTKFRFADAAEAIYQFVWHELADKYVEEIKTREDKELAAAVLKHIYLTSLKLLHPFMPFVTEAIWGEIKNLRKYPDQMLITSEWLQV